MLAAVGSHVEVTASADNASQSPDQSSCQKIGKSNVKSDIVEGNDTADAECTHEHSLLGEDPVYGAVDSPSDEEGACSGEKSCHHALNEEGHTNE